MNLQRNLIATALAIASIAGAEVRTWTSASDASRTFKGELVSIEGKKITVAVDGAGEKTFDLSILSKADQDYVTANAEKIAAMPENKVAKELRNNLARGAVAGGAEYYILYFASST